MAVADDKLSKLFDNELTSDEAEALRRELSVEDQAKLAALSDLHLAVHDAVETEAASHELDLWSQLEAKLALPSTVVPEAPVIPLRRKLLLRTTAVVSALALAASLLLVLRPATSPGSSCDVEELEVIGSGATVLQVADDRGNDTTLIWFDHQEEDEWESL